MPALEWGRWEGFGIWYLLYLFLENTVYLKIGYKALCDLALVYFNSSPTPQSVFATCQNQFNSKNVTLDILILFILKV